MDRIKADDKYFQRQKNIYEIRSAKLPFHSACIYSTSVSEHLCARQHSEARDIKMKEVQCLSSCEMKCM